MNREQRRAQRSKPPGMTVEPVPPERFGRTLARLIGASKEGKDRLGTTSEMLDEYDGDQRLAGAALARMVLLSKASNEGLFARVEAAEKETGLEELLRFIDEIAAVAPCDARGGFDQRVLVDLLVKRARDAAEGRPRSSDPLPETPPPATELPQDATNDDPRDPAKFLREAGVDIEANVRKLTQHGRTRADLDPRFEAFMSERLAMIDANMTREDFIEVIHGHAERLQFRAELARMPGWETRSIEELRRIAGRFSDSTIDEEDNAREKQLLELKRKRAEEEQRLPTKDEPKE